MKHALTTTALLLAACLSSCASPSRTIRYSRGEVKTGTVEYRSTAPALLREHNRKPYYVTVDGSYAQVKLLSLRRNGMRAISDPAQAYLTVAIDLGEVVRGETRAVRLGEAWVPAFEVEVPYEIAATSGGEVLRERWGSYEGTLTLEEQRFENREQALAALELVEKLGQESVARRARERALPTVLEEADVLAASLFRERDVALDLPVVRVAAGLDLEEPFDILSGAHGAGDVNAALERYRSEGLEQVADDGTPNTTASYGVACGIAACQLMLGDLAGAWESARVAYGLEPDGTEAHELRRLICEQERAAGLRVLPADEREAFEARALAESHEETGAPAD